MQDGEIIDTIHVYRYKAAELSALLEELGQPRDYSMSWEKINAMKQFDNMLNNFGAYKDITISDEERQAEEAAARGASQEL